MIDHTWANSPLIAFMKTVWDGSNYRYVRLEMCSVCGVLKANPKYAGWDTYEDAMRNWYGKED